MKQLYSSALSFVALCMINICAYATSSIGANIGAPNVYTTKTISGTTHKIAYVFNSTTDDKSSLFKCTINDNDMTFTDSSGKSTCVAVDTDKSSGKPPIGNTSGSSWLYAHSATVSGNYLFVLSLNANGTSWIQSCPIITSGDDIGSLNTCTTVANIHDYVGNTILAVTLNNKSYLYVGDGHERISVTTINDGILGTQTIDGTTNITNIGENGHYIKQMVYYTDGTNNTLYYIHGPDSHKNYYVAKCTLDSATGGSNNTCTNIHTYSALYNKEAGDNGSYTTVTTYGITIVSNDLYVSIKSPYLQSGNSGDVTKQDYRIYYYDFNMNSDTSSNPYGFFLRLDTIIYQLFTTVGNDGNTYIYAGSQGQDMKVCTTMTSSPSCTDTGAISGTTVGVPIGLAIYEYTE